VADAPLAGRTAIVTGGTRGLGLAIARAFTAAGARVVVTGREPAQLDVESIRADVTDPAACAALAARAPDVLVNNAAITGPVGPLDQTAWEDWVAAIGINLLGPVQMCRAVLPGMRERGGGKIINLSGGGATGPRPNFSAYATAKAGLVRFTETLARELDGTGVDVNAIAPGALNTRLLDEVIEAGPDKVGKAFYERSLKQQREGGAPLDKGARLAVFLASKKSDGITGRLISALWDDWQNLPSKRDELSTSDVYTLRRIVPEDRGMKW